MFAITILALMSSVDAQCFENQKFPVYFQAHDVPVENSYQSITSHETLTGGPAIFVGGVAN